MRVVVILVCLTLGAGLLVACSSPTTAIPSLTTPTPSGVESSIEARIIAENDAVLEATVREKEGKDIYVAVVITDNTGEAAAKILIDRIIEQLGELVEGDNYSYAVMVSYPDGRVVISGVADPIDRFLDKEDRR